MSRQISEEMGTEIVNHDGKYKTASHGIKSELAIPEYQALDEEEIKRLTRKIDWRIMPIFAILYVLSFLDRSNIGNAKIAGMNEELGLTGAQYNMALTVFFFPYALFEIPSNIVLKLTRPNYWMAFLVIAWGTVVTLQGIVQNYHQLLVTRVLLGLTEAGFFPAVSYLLTTWYSRWQLQTRLAIVYSSASLAGAFSGLLAFGIQHMDGVGGLGGWRWIFILEGILTVLVGCTVPWTFPESPDDSKFLSPEEKEAIKRRIQQDEGVSGDSKQMKEKFEWKHLKAVLLDWKIYVGVIMFWGNSISTYGFTFSSPTIIKQLGYTAAHAQLMTVPIYLFGALSTIFFARLADKRKSRWIFIAIPYGIALIGFIGLLSIPHPELPQLTYFFLFFITGGLYPAVIGCISWVGNNLAPSFKRAIGMALLLTIGNLGGAIGSNIFLQHEAPHYWLGYGFSAGIVTAAIISAVLLHLILTRLNRTRNEMSEETIRAKYSEGDLLALGDKSPLFRYAT